MRNKLLLIVLSIAVLAIINLKNNTQVLTVSEKNLVTKEIVDSETDKIRKTSQQNKKPKKPIPQLQKLYQELSVENYSKEPIIELTAAALGYMTCNKMEKRDTRKFHNRYYQTSKKLQIQIEKLSQSCNTLKSQYPSIINSDKGIDSKLLFLSLASTSQYSELIQRGMSIEHMAKQQQNEYFLEVIKAILHSKNAQLISMLSEVLSEPVVYNEILHTAKILGTINRDYLVLISKQAVSLLACEYNNGMTCSDIGDYMLNACEANDEACGIDLQTWFAYNHTEAHNRDIYIVLDYFKGL